MRAHQALFALVCIHGLSLSLAGTIIKANEKPEAKNYPYCNSPTDPSIPCEGPNGNRPNPDAACSNIFFMCTNGESRCYNCQDINGIRLYYDKNYPPGEERCDYRENVRECDGVPESSTAPSVTTDATTASPSPSRTSPTTTPSPTTASTTPSPTTPSPTPSTTTTASTKPTVPPGYKCPADNGFFPINPDECLKNFYACVNGVPYIETCPGNSYFDPAVLLCVQEENLSCNYNCVKDGFFPVPSHNDDQCFQGFVICVGTTAYPARCPELSVFDPEALICLPFELNDCDAPTTSKPLTTDKTIPTFDPEDLCCPGVGQWPYPDFCESYFICNTDDEVTGVFTCPRGFVFVPQVDGSGVCERGTCSSVDYDWLNAQLAATGRRPCLMKK